MLFGARPSPPNLLDKGVKGWGKSVLGGRVGGGGGMAGGSSSSWQHDFAGCLCVKHQAGVGLLQATGWGGGKCPKGKFGLWGNQFVFPWTP